MTVQESDDDILAKLAHVLRQRSREARGWEAQSKQWQARADAQRARADAAERQCAELTQLVGAETPIAAFDLAASWGVEKAALMEECAELRASASMAIDRWQRSEAIRGAAVEALALANKERDEARQAIGREWLHVFDTLIEDAKAQYSAAQDIDRRDLCFFWAGKQSGLRYLRTLAEDDISGTPRATASGEG